MQCTIAGFSISCVGDNGRFSYVPSRSGNTLADRVVQNSLRFRHPDYVRYSFENDRGGDERQYCSPGVDLPVVALTRSKFLEFPEFHTSLDNLSLVSPTALQESFEQYVDCLQALEANERYQVTCLGEPQLGKRGMYPNLATATSAHQVRALMNLIAYSDGTNDLIALSDRIGVSVPELRRLAMPLLQAKLLRTLKWATGPA
jgi:aminopeptidase-like protein